VEATFGSNAINPIGFQITAVSRCRTEGRYLRCALPIQQLVNDAWKIPDNRADNNDSSEKREDCDHQIFPPPTFRPLPTPCIIRKSKPFVS
jgi:hypothetical protein